MKSQSLFTRRGLTLMELIVVMVILVALATLIIPRIGSIASQSGNASASAILQGISEAESRYEMQFNQIPSGWDGIVDSSGASLYSKLHPKLKGTLDSSGTALVVGQLTGMQAQSLMDAGMAGVHLQDTSWNGAPSESGRVWQTINSGANMAFLQLPTGVTAANFDSVGHNVLFSDRAFSIQPFTSMWNNQFVVVGFGNESSLKRNSVQETPLFTSVIPSVNYARALCVFMVPPASVAAVTDTGYFKAKYIGCFAPDGTCMMDNLNNFSQGQAPQ